MIFHMMHHNIYLEREIYKTFTCDSYLVTFGLGSWSHLTHLIFQVTSNSMHSHGLPTRPFSFFFSSPCNYMQKHGTHRFITVKNRKNKSKRKKTSYKNQLITATGDVSLRTLFKWLTPLQYCGEGCIDIPSMKLSNMSLHSSSSFLETADVIKAMINKVRCIISLFAAKEIR